MGKTKKVEVRRSSRLAKSGAAIGSSFKNDLVREGAELDYVIRDKIKGLIYKFRKSKDEAYTFEGLTKSERAAMHLLCRRLNLQTKSSGSGNQRRITVSKKADTVKEKLTSVTFSEEAKVVLGDLFTRYPPHDGEMGDELVGKVSVNASEVHKKRDDMFSRPSMSKAEIGKKVESLASRVEHDPKLKQINEKRSKLPIASFRDVITSTIDSHQVVLISGATGCGKTTQVPQYILEHMWGKGEMCKIVCAQPRRISATSVAERISSERGETIGDSVGYKIRLESKGGKNSPIVFCTNGVLLRILITEAGERLRREASGKRENDGVFSITHIIVDEIHERDRFSDFMLAIMRDMLPAYPNLRLVLMSATIDVERFSEYFGGCPIIGVPGFTYPVKTFYLEDVLSILKSAENKHLDCASRSVTTEDSKLEEEYRVAMDEAINLAWSNDEFDPLLDLVSSKGGANIFDFRQSVTGVTPLMVFAGKGRVGDLCMLLSFGADCNIHDNEGITALQWAQRENQGQAAEILKKHMENGTNSEEEKLLLDEYLSTVNPDMVDGVLIEKLLRKICTESTEGAILVFLPGWDDIRKTTEKLENSSFFNNSSKFIILALHSMVPSAEQKKVFKRPPLGCRKIILSTNIAETAVTIDDVVYVIDSGRMKEKSYDPYNSVSTLLSSWVSKASANQREGRAGRCQAGICFHLYSKVRAASLQPFQVPEIKRMPIEELCLQVKLLDPCCNIDDFLSKTLDPPVFESIHNAVTLLQGVGALSPDEKLTELGQKLGSLSVNPLTSKMLFFAILMNCLDPALTLACASDFRSPFTLPMTPIEKTKAASAKAELASLYGGHSDQLAVIAAFECWKHAKKKRQELQFCSTYFVSSSTMKMLSRMRNQLQSELCRYGFIPEDSSPFSVNAHDPGIVNALLVAGLYPMVGKLVPSRKGNRSSVKTAAGLNVQLDYLSVNSALSSKKSEHLVMFDEITRGDWGLRIRNCSVIGPLPLLLLASEIEVFPVRTDKKMRCESEDGDEETEKIMSSPGKRVKVVVDKWLSFEVTAIDVAQIYCLKERLSTATLFKVINPRKVLPEPFGPSISAIARILSRDGLSWLSSISKSENSSPNNFLLSLMGHDPCQYKIERSAPTEMANLDGRSKSTNHIQQPPPLLPVYPYRDSAPLSVPKSTNHIQQPPPLLPVYPYRDSAPLSVPMCPYRGEIPLSVPMDPNLSFTPLSVPINIPHIGPAPLSAPTYPYGGFTPQNPTGPIHRSMNGNSGPRRNPSKRKRKYGSNEGRSKRKRKYGSNEGRPAKAKVK